MKNVELRWKVRYIEGPPVRRKEMVLEYRTKVDVGGPYENYQWTDWMIVPEVEETN